MENPNFVSNSNSSSSSSLSLSSLPIRLSATVVKGYGRGSKVLGIPTANLSMQELTENINNNRDPNVNIDAIKTGIWYGFACLDGKIYKTATSIGWNPQFDNKEKTVEPHIIHEFPEDFYGERLTILLCGYIRDEMPFESIDSLIAAIKGDIERSKVELDKTENRRYIDVKEEKMKWCSSDDVEVREIGLQITDNNIISNGIAGEENGDIGKGSSTSNK